MERGALRNDILCSSCSWLHMSRLKDGFNTT